MSSSGTAACLVALTGDQPAEAWSRVVAQHGADIWSLVRGLFRTQHEAEDAHQEFWLRLPRAAASFRPAEHATEGAARAWLMRVAYTTAMDRHRQRRAAEAVPLCVNQPANEVRMDDHEARTALVEQVRIAIDELPENQRRPLVLHLIGGLGYEDLAADLNCSVVNARVRVHRALKRVRDRVGVKEAGLPDRAMACLLLPLLGMSPPAVPQLAQALAHSATSAAATSAAAGVGGATSVSGSLVTGVAGMAGAKLAVLTAVGVTTLAVAGVTLVRVAAPAPAPLSAVHAAVAPGAPGAQPVLIDDYEQPLLQVSSNTGALLALVPAADGRAGHALRVGWPAVQTRFVDFIYPLPPAVPALSSRVAGTAVFKVWRPADSPVHRVSVRFVDAANETFQWPAELPQSTAAGWREVRIPLAATTFTGHWGTATVGHDTIELPLRFNGFSVDFTAVETAAGSVQFDDPYVDTTP